MKKLFARKGSYNFDKEPPASENVVEILNTTTASEQQEFVNDDFMNEFVRSVHDEPVPDSGSCMIGRQLSGTHLSLTSGVFEFDNKHYIDDETGSVLLDLDQVGTIRNGGDGILTTRPVFVFCTQCVLT